MLEFCVDNRKYQVIRKNIFYSLDNTKIDIHRNFGLFFFVIKKWLEKRRLINHSDKCALMIQSANFQEISEYRKAVDWNLFYLPRNLSLFPE